MRSEKKAQAQGGLNRREFLQTGAVAATGAMTLGGFHFSRPANAQSTPKPNIVIILTDQQNIDTISAYQKHFTHEAHGCRWLSTPNLDRLSKRGVSFLESHSANPVCSPARSTLFTGRMSIETSVTRNNVGIDKDVPNMGQWFEANSDYARVYCGKWHAGGPWNYPLIAGDRKIPGFATLPGGARGTGDIADYQVSGAVGAFVRNYQEKDPFLIVAGLMNPHDICYWTPPLGGKVLVPDWDVFELGDALPPLPPNFDYDFPEPRPNRVTSFNEMNWRNYTYEYYRMVEKVDADVGRILDAVESRDDDTLIIFTSDHGEGAGRHMRVQKWHPYDESVRVPLIVSWPGQVAEDVIDTDHLVSGVDLMSTVCDFAGIPAPPHARGRSLKPLLQGDTPESWRDNVYAEIQHTGRMIRTADYKYVKFYAFSGNADKPFIDEEGNAVQFEPGMGHRYEEHPVRLLFDMKKDPWETNNLFEDTQYADVMEAHEKILREEYEAHLIPGETHTRG